MAPPLATVDHARSVSSLVFQPVCAVMRPAAEQQRSEYRSQHHGLQLTCCDLCAAQKTDGGTPNGSLKSSQVGQNPFLTTLPGRGNGQTLVTVGAPGSSMSCATQHNNISSYQLLSDCDRTLVPVQLDVIRRQHCKLTVAALHAAGPCAGNTPHTHPRGSEISYITEGEVTALLTTPVHPCKIAIRTPALLHCV